MEFIVAQYTLIQELFIRFTACDFQWKNVSAYMSQKFDEVEDIVQGILLPKN